MSRDLRESASVEDLWDERGRGLPLNLHLGTSTWAFADWKGILYRREYRSEKAFTRDALAEYAQVPWFRTVCIDSLFYKPPKEETLLRYASQVPVTFKWVSKVWERITIHTYPKHPRYGVYAGRKNPDFLNADLFKDLVLSQYDSPEVHSRTGPLVFQFAPFSEHVLPYGDFTGLLSRFLEALPKTFRYAIEVRNAQILTADYVSMINSHGVAHCFNHWNGMPPLLEQMKMIAEAGGLTADFYIGRLLTPLGVSYEEAEKLLEPYTSLKSINVEMRSDVLRLAKKALATKRDLFLTANNKAEGCAPLTVASVGDLILTEVVPTMS